MEHSTPPHKELSFSELRTKVKAYHNLENTLNLPPPQTLEEKGVRKIQMRRVLQLPESKPLQEKINLVKESLIKTLSVANQKFPNFPVFNNISILEMEKGMSVISSPPILYIEKELLNSASVEMINSIVVHELYHSIYQNLSINMEHIKHIQDQFGSQVKAELDIDSDIESFRVTSESLGLDFVKHVSMMYESSTFRDQKVRIPKFSRFLGSLLGIYIYEKHNQKIIPYPYINTTLENEIPFTCIFEGRKLAKVTIPYQITLLIKSLTENPLQVSKEIYVKTISNYFQEITNQIYPQIIK